MPEPNTRVVVLGAPKADKEFSIVSNDRQDLERKLEKFDGDVDKLAKALERELRDVTRGL